MIILILKRIYQFGLETRFIVITPWAPKATWFPKAVRLGFSYCTEYCREFGLEELEPNPINLINFLYYQFKEKNRQYSTINSYRSAVSSTLRNYPECKVPVGQTPIVCRFMRGVHRLKPPKKKSYFQLNIFTRCWSWRNSTTEISVVEDGIFGRLSLYKETCRCLQHVYR